MSTQTRQRAEDLAETVEKWTRMPLLSLDFESTGVDVHNDRAVQAAIVEFHPGVRRPHVTTWLINPGIEIPDEAAAVHGITTEQAQLHGRHPEAALFEIAARIGPWLGSGRPVLAFNAAYDMSLLEAELARWGIDTIASRLPHGVGPIIDPLVIDKQIDAYRKGGRKLTTLCEHYGVVMTGAHDAAADALAAARLFGRMVVAHPKAFAGQTLAGLHRAQVSWRMRQQASLREYFDSKGTAHDGVCGEWPVHTACAPVPAAAGVGS